VLRFVPHLGLLLAVIAVVLLALVPIGWRGGWWPYRFSLLSLMAYSAYFGIAAVIVSVLALVISVFGRSAIGRGRIAIAILALATGGLTAYVPWHYRALARSVPPIDDITADTDNPPAFVAVIKLREAEDSNPSTYAGAETAALQKRGYPDLAPLSLALAPDKGFPIALATAKKMSWTIIEADPTTRHIEVSEQSKDEALHIDVEVPVEMILCNGPERCAFGDGGVRKQYVDAPLLGFYGRIEPVEIGEVTHVPLNSLDIVTDLGSRRI